MSEAERRKATLLWLRYASEDLAAAEALLKFAKPTPRHACLMAQQAAEKALKAALIFAQVPPPRQHDLDALRDLLPDDWPAKLQLPRLAELTAYAVQSRYPGDWPVLTKTEARRALRQARAMVRSVMQDLRSRGCGPEAPGPLPPTP